MIRIPIIIMSTLTLINTSFANATETAPRIENCARLLQLESSSSLSQFFRSNTRHYWLAVEKFKLKFVSPNILQTGTILGDSHLGNLGPVYLGSKVIWAPNDLDDGGTGHFVFDIAQLMINAKFVTNKIKYKKMWQAYLSGLNKENFAVPEELVEYANVSTAAYKKAQAEYTEDKIKNNINFKFMPGSIERLPTHKWGLSRTQIKSAIDNYFSKAKVLDYAVRPKTRGGSKDSWRVWALVLPKGSSSPQIFELKEAVNSTLVLPQKPIQERMLSLMEEFWGKDATLLHGFLELNGHPMFVRPKKIDLFTLEYDPTEPEDIDFLKALAYWNAYNIGKIHAQQPSSKIYKNEMNKDPELYFSQIKSFANAYREFASDIFFDE